MDTLEELVTPAIVAERFHISKSTVYNLINQGIIPAIKIGKSVRLSPKAVQQELSKMQKKSVGVAA